MKTLDEVIEALEICSQMDADCDKCPYKATAKGWCEEKDRDALYYLKEYRNCGACAYADSYLRCTKEDRNDPLSWDELRTMGGKPVWVESSDSFNRRRWMFVGEWFDDDEMRLFDMGNDYPDYVSNNRYESGTWQAYRKERTE